MYGFSMCTDDNHSLKLVAYRLVHTDKPYINLHILCFFSRLALSQCDKVDKALFFLILGLLIFFQNIKVGRGEKIEIKITKKFFFYLI